MKTIAVTYLANGDISSAPIEPISFEMENSLQIAATFPTMTGVKRAYVKAQNGSSHMFVVNDADYPTALTVVGDVATLNIPVDFMVEGTLKVGFENLYGEISTYFKPLNIRIDDFVDLESGAITHNYTVTVTVDSTETLSAGQSATVINLGTSKDVKLKFGIPRGANIDLQKSATHIQWKLETSSTWIDLVPLTDLESDDVEFLKTTDYIQYRYYYPKTGTYSNWVNLVALADITGPQGVSGVYLGSDTPPEGYTVWVSDDGLPSDIDTHMTNGDIHVRELLSTDFDSLTQTGLYKLNSESSAPRYVMVINQPKLGLATHDYVTQIFFYYNNSLLCPMQWRICTDGVWGGYQNYITASQMLALIQTDYTAVSFPTEKKQAWDSINHKPVWYNGTAWIYADGTVV